MINLQKVYENKKEINPVNIKYDAELILYKYFNDNDINKNWLSSSDISSCEIKSLKDNMSFLEYENRYPISSLKGKTIRLNNQILSNINKEDKFFISSLINITKEIINPLNKISEETSLLTKDNKIQESKFCEYFSENSLFEIKEKIKYNLSILFGKSSVSLTMYPNPILCLRNILRERVRRESVQYEELELEKSYPGFTFHFEYIYNDKFKIITLNYFIDYKFEDFQNKNIPTLRIKHIFLHFA